MCSYKNFIFYVVSALACVCIVYFVVPFSKLEGRPFCVPSDERKNSASLQEVKKKKAKN